MTSGFNNATPVHNMNDIRLQGRREAVGDDQGGPAGDKSTKTLQPVCFRPGIHGAGRLVQDDELRISQKGPRQGHGNSRRQKRHHCLPSPAGASHRRNAVHKRAGQVNGGHGKQSLDQQQCKLDKYQSSGCLPDQPEGLRQIGELLPEATGYLGKLFDDLFYLQGAMVPLNIRMIYIISVIRSALSTSAMRWSGIFPARSGCRVTGFMNRE